MYAPARALAPPRIHRLVGRPSNSKDYQLTHGFRVSAILYNFLATKVNKYRRDYIEPGFRS
jgi:hypothetical protein